MSMVKASRIALARPWLCRLVASVMVASAAGLAAPAVAQAQDARLTQRLDRLERDLSTLQRQVYRGEAPAGEASGVARPAAQPMDGDVAGRLQGRIADLERLVSDLTGRVEETQHQTRRLSQRLDQLVSDIDFRLGRIEQATGLTAVPGPDGQAAPAAGSAPLDDGQGAPDSATAPEDGAGQGPQQGVLGYMRQDGSAVAGPDSNATGNRPAGLLRPQGNAGASTAQGPEGDQQTAAPLPADASPEEQYRHAFDLLRKGDFAAAEQSLKAFLEAHPDHNLAGNAQYWLGESYYVRGDMQAAAVAFLDGYRTYPKSGKGPDNLLKLGMTMGQLGQTKEACAALEKLGLEYPQAPDAIKRRAVAERQKMGCP